MADNNNENMIMVPLEGKEAGDISANTEDSLAHELATIQQSSKKIAIIGSRNLPITHQQLIETIAYALTNNGNTLMRDGLTGQYFRYDIDKFKQKAIELANDELNEGYVGTPDWLISLGLNVPDTLLGMGWSIADQGKAVTIDYHAVVAHSHNDEPCLVIEYDPMPVSDYNIFYK